MPKRDTEGGCCCFHGTQEAVTSSSFAGPKPKTPYGLTSGQASVSHPYRVEVGGGRERHPVASERQIAYLKVLHSDCLGTLNHKVLG